MSPHNNSAAVEASPSSTTRTSPPPYTASNSNSLPYHNHDLVHPDEPTPSPQRVPMSDFIWTLFTCNVVIRLTILTIVVVHYAQFIYAFHHNEPIQMDKLAADVAFCTALLLIRLILGSLVNCNSEEESQTHRNLGTWVLLGVLWLIRAVFDKSKSPSQYTYTLSNKVCLLLPYADLMLTSW